MITGDLQEAFLEIRMGEEKPYPLRFQWKHPESSDFETYRFTRALFGLTCSPFLLGGVINQYLTVWEDKHSDIVEELCTAMYVDYLLIGGTPVNEVQRKTTIAKDIFEDGCFTLHKWRSNASQVEAETTHQL